MSFCTAVNCMDGRVQIPVIRYLQERFDVEYVDVTTEPGPVRSLSEPIDADSSRAIVEHVEISIREHGSTVIAVAAHADCAGNTVTDEMQRAHVEESASFLAAEFPQTTVVGLWLGDDWVVEPVCTIPPSEAQACPR